MSFTTWFRDFRSKRKLFPTGKRERILLWGGGITVGLFVIYVLQLGGIEFAIRPLYVGFYVGLVLYVWVYVYVSQRIEIEDEFERYSKNIADIESIGTQLSNLVVFLKEEREKVTESEVTLRKLRAEQSELEPMVMTNRDTVNAILSVHAKTTASRAWRERALGFMSGVITSLLASILFEYFRR